MANQATSAALDPATMTESLDQPPVPNAADSLDRHEIVNLAYRLWQERGCPDGSSEDDWLEAEDN